MLKDWRILHHEVMEIVTLARRREASIRIVKNLAPNLAHWAFDEELQTLLDDCPPVDYAACDELTKVDSLKRRKRVAAVRYLDTLMASRLGYPIETIRSYRERAARAEKSACTSLKNKVS